MVGIVIVSHSFDIAKGVKELAYQMAPEVKIESAGGTYDGRIGTDMDKILQAIKKCYSDDGVIVLFDLGSAAMNAEMAVESLDKDMRKNIKVIDAPLVEGAVLASVESSMNKDINEIESNLKKII